MRAFLIRVVEFAGKSGFLKPVVDFVKRFVDTDGDGRIEIDDVPGAMARAAAIRAQALASARVWDEVVEAIKDAAAAGQVTAGGKVLTAADVQAAWDAAKVPFSKAAAEAKADMVK